MIIEATLKDIETGDTETLNFASYDVLTIALDDTDMIILDDWQLIDQDGRTISRCCAVKGNAEPALIEALQRRGLLESVE